MFIYSALTGIRTSKLLLRSWPINLSFSPLILTYAWPKSNVLAPNQKVKRFARCPSKMSMTLRSSLYLGDVFYTCLL